MQRRDVLRSLGALALGSALAPLSGADRLRLAAHLHGGGALGQAPALKVLDPKQAELVAAVADTILPRTDTPGALDAGTVEFLDRLLESWHTPAERSEFLSGLAAFEARATETAGGGFATLDPAGRTRVLEAIDGAGRNVTAASAEAFYRRLKEVTIYAFLTSKAVQDGVLRTPIIPGRFEGCIPV